MFIKISQNPEELRLYQKRDSGTGVFCEFCEIFKSTFFTENLRETTSEHHKVKVFWCFQEVYK